MLEELASCLVDERKMSRNSSPTPSPLGMRLQVVEYEGLRHHRSLVGRSEALPAVR